MQTAAWPTRHRSLGRASRAPAITWLRGNKGEVRAAIFRSEAGFPKKPEMAFRRAAGRMDGSRARIVFDMLEPGDYAVVVIHDDNQNGKLDTGHSAFPRRATASHGTRRAVLGRLPLQRRGSRWARRRKC